VSSPAVSSPASDPAAAAAIHATVTLLAIASFFSGAAIRICDGLLPRLSTDFSVTTGIAGQVVFAFAVAYGVSQLGFGPLGDRFGKARVVCAALFASAAGALACALAPDFEVLVLLRVLWGVAAGGVIPLSLAWIGDAVHYEQRQATLARLLLGTLSGMTAGQLGGGLFADSEIGWRGAFGCLAVGYLVIGALLLARMRRIPAAAPAAPGGKFAFLTQVASVLRLRWARVVVAVALTEGVFLLGPLAYLPSYLHQRFGVALSAAAALISLFAVGGVLYALVARHVVRRLGERRMVRIGGAIMGLGFLAWYLVPVAWLAAPVALAVGFGTYLFHNTLQTNATQMAPATRGSGMALFAFCFFLGQALGAWLAGYAFDHYGALPLLLVPAIVLPLTCWAFAHALLRRAQG
jgi:predicted MFS family arabinose efflux permease